MPGHDHHDHDHAGHSVALLADAAHNLGDVLGLLLAWWAGLRAPRYKKCRSNSNEGNNEGCMAFPTHFPSQMRRCSQPPLRTGI